MLRYLVVFLLVVCIPTLTIARRPVSQKEIEKELFKHVEFPCAANMAISTLKELDDEDYSRTDLENMTALLLQTTIDKTKKSVKTTASSIILHEMSRNQRRAVYQMLVIGCLTGIYGASAGELADDDYVAHLAANGWEFSPVSIDLSTMGLE